jgi:hypothetical protein
MLTLQADRTDIMALGLLSVVEAGEPSRELFDGVTN